jgi:magnesium chelatase family protein
MIGGGASPQPGEISLAHNGILFLDELPEFKRHVLEVLRQPLEERSIHVSRARYKVEYPANFILVAAMNPCPCGYHNHPHKECHCGPGLIKHYLSRISGPLLDRIDLHVEVAPVPIEKLGTRGSGHSSSEILEQVLGARQVQFRRFRPHDPPVSNAALNAQQVEKWGALDVASRTLLGRACNELGLSARAYMRIRKIARTIADLEGSDRILPVHVAEAVSYRNLDRTDWSG